MFDRLRALFSSSLKINGVDLPREFISGTIINGVVLSRDGKQCAAVNSNREVVIASVPPDGLVQIDGQLIDFSEAIRNRTRNVIFGSKIEIDID